MSNQKVAFLFPGQGSQKVGMLSDYAENDVVKDVFSIASKTLGFDLWELIQSDPEQKINLTETTQPALLTSSVALWRLCESKGIEKPAILAGHSLGEWSALCCAGAVSLEDAVRLVSLRGKYMQEAVPQGVGGMAAILGLADAEVEQACAEAETSFSSDLPAGAWVAPVNYNSPGQLVIAGKKEAVEKAVELCKEKKAKRAMLLPVSAPFHTSLMKPAADRLADDMKSVQFASPSIPVVHNVDAATRSDPNEIKEILIKQIYSPVKWVDCINEIQAHGVETMLECGPGKVLGGLNRRIDKSIKSIFIESENDLQAYCES